MSRLAVFGPMRSTVLVLAAGACGLGMTAWNMPQAMAAPTIIELTQTPCQFVEPEGGDHDYVSHGKDDCVAINDRDGAARLAKAEAMHLKPGEYIFRVTNENVPYELGFWLRDKDYDWTDKILGQKFSVSGGGLTEGKTVDYHVTLEPGQYVFSCPLNPTPAYPLVVEGDASGK